MFGTVSPPYWDDKPVVLVGGGPSLIGFNFSQLKSKQVYVVGINQAIFDAPCCAGVSADVMFMHQRRAPLEEYATKFPVYACVPESIHPTKMVHLDKRWKNAFSEHPSVINTVGSSGFAALNVAYLMKARRIILLGFDYCVLNRGRSHHYHNKYPWHRRTTGEWPRWAAGYETALPQLRAANIEVINASPQSAIKAFRKISIIDAMKGL